MTVGAPGAAAAPAGPGAATASAPAKVILLGEHAVNRGGTALSTAVERRVRCRVALRRDGIFDLRAGEHHGSVDARGLAAFKESVDALHAAGDTDGIARAAAADFFAPARYVLAALAPRLGLGGLDVVWDHLLPIKLGLGSGAAASCALAVAASAAVSAPLAPAEVAALAWQGDRIAHGGVASGLDASGCAYGGVVAYHVDRGATPLPTPRRLPLVVADTGVIASTAVVNGEVRRRLAQRPALMGRFGEIDELVGLAAAAVADGDLRRLGRCMNLNQLVLEQVGVSTPAIERLAAAALDAGALGAKLSGSGGGGIVIALCERDAVEPVTAAMAAAGAGAFAVEAGAPGARVDPPQT